LYYDTTKFYVFHTVKNFHFTTQILNYTSIFAYIRSIKTYIAFVELSNISAHIRVQK